MSFVHPFTGEPTAIAAGLPPDLAGPLGAMGFPGEVLGRYLDVEAE
jgi:hypothetical protein